MAEPRIDVDGLPFGVSGPYDTVVGVDEATGAARRFSMPQAGVPRSYATRASLPAASGFAEGYTVWVNNDPNPANNGTWAVLGGAWVQSADRVSGLEGRVSAAELLIQPQYPIKSSNTAANAGGDAALLGRLQRGLIDLKLYGLPATDSYFIERFRRNLAGNWHIVVKRASDNATVVQLFGPLTEPDDPNTPMDVNLAAVVPGAFGVARVRWSYFVAGATNVGLAVGLSPDTVVRKATPLEVMPLQSARLGMVIMPITAGQKAEVDEAARTFTWPAMMIIDGRAGTSGRYALAAGSVTFDAPFQVAWIDLVEAATYGNGTAPASIVKKGTYAQGEPFNTARYVASSSQFPLAWSAGAGRVDVNPMIRVQADAPAPSGGYADKIVVRREAGALSVYMRANGRADSTTYILYRLFRYTAADGDVWTVSGVWEAARTGNESFTLGKRLVMEAVELLYAQQEQGAADFTGGQAHGDEQITETPTLILDGQEVAISGASAWFHVDEVTFIQKSRHYRVGTALGTPLAERGLMLTFRDGYMTADQRVHHLVSYTVANAYTAMLAPHRYETFVGGTSENTSSAQISGKYAHNGAYSPSDISVRQASADPVADYANLSPPVTKVKMWGTYGVECEVEVLEASAPILTDIFFMQRNNYAYNKGYIGFIGGYSGNQAVTAATRWRWKTRWAFRSKN